MSAQSGTTQTTRRNIPERGSNLFSKKISAHADGDLRGGGGGRGVWGGGGVVPSKKTTPYKKNRGRTQTKQGPPFKKNRGRP